MTVPETQIGVTLYNLREHCKTPEDLGKTFARVRAIGYRAVQVSAVNLPAPTIREALEKNGLYCCATHENMTAYLTQFDEVVKKLNTLDCTFTALGSPTAEYWSAEGVKRLIRELNEVGRKFRDKGIRFGFHNHHREFERYTGKTFMQELYEQTDPAAVDFEIDTHWIQRGGEDPSAWILKVKDRIPVVHLKDFAILNHEPVFAEVGEGNLDWPSILAACRKAGARWYVVEQDQPWPGRDIFDSIRMSYDNLVRFGLS